MSESLTLKDDNGQPLIIGPTQTGTLGINARSGLVSILIVLSGERLEAFRDAIGQAAGQPVARYPLYGCCPHCEHCGQCQQPGSCHHGYEQPPHLGPCKYDDCEPGHEQHGEAIMPGQPAAEVADEPR